MSSSRSIGMGLGPIPYIAFAEYARFNGIRDPDDFDTLRSIVGEIDTEYLRLSQPKSSEGSGD